MKKIFFLSVLMVFIAFLLIGCLTEGTGDLYGRAILEGGIGMSYGGITVCLQGTNLSTTTNVTGNFIIPDVPAGTYTLNFSFAGYVNQSISVTIEAGQSTTAPDVTLEQE